MKQFFLAASFAAMMVPLGGKTVLAAGLIERACLKSDRRAVNPTLCTCIQAVADQVLDAGEQRKGAALFENPHQSQDIRQSDDSRDESFWLKWKLYGATVEEYCS